MLEYLGTESSKVKYQTQLSEIRYEQSKLLNKLG